MLPADQLAGLGSDVTGQIGPETRSKWRIHAGIYQHNNILKYSQIKTFLLLLTWQGNKTKYSDRNALVSLTSTLH